jgi:hypothetical protein
MQFCCRAPVPFYLYVQASHLVCINTFGNDKLPTFEGLLTPSVRQVARESIVTRRVVAETIYVWHKGGVIRTIKSLGRIDHGFIY